MFKHYLTTALRYFGRNKFTTTINVLCLAMGMTCFAAAYGVVAWFTNADRHYANSDRTFVVTETLNAKGSTAGVPSSPLTSWVLGSLVRTNLQGTATVARLTLGRSAPVAVQHEKSYFVSVGFADPEFLDIFDQQFISGDATALQRPHTAVVTEKTAQLLFGRANVVGETVLLRNLERVSITGVIAAPKQPSHFGSGTALAQVEMFVSMDTYEAIVRATSSPTRLQEALGTWGSNMSNILYVLTPSDGSMSPDILKMRLAEIAARHAPTEEGTFHVGMRPLNELYSILIDGAIRSDQTGVSASTILLLLGGLILFISCVNYANLATAQSAVRAKEIAMRRVVGAGRLEIIRQYLFETALLALAALLLVFILLAGALGILSAVLGINLLVSTLLSAELWLALLSTLAIVTLVAGAYPALVLSRMRPMQALRGGVMAPGSRFVQTLLVGLQFGTASFLLIALLVMQSQNKALDRQRASIAGEPVLAITSNTREAGVDMKVLRNELLLSPDVELVAAADEVPGSMFAGNHRMVSRSLEANATRTFVTTNSIDQEYFNSLRMEMVAGRNFDSAKGDEWDQNKAQGDDEMNVVINRLLAERLGWPEPGQAVGQIVNGLAGLGEHSLRMRVIGVVETKPLTLTAPLGSLATIYTLEPERAAIPIVRLSKTNTQAGLSYVESTWKKLSPNVPLRRVFLDESFEQSSRIVAIIRNAFAGVAMFAFVISAMGLIGMATHVTARRTREIGVRKTLGASVARVLVQLLRDFSKPVVIANVVIWPLAYVVANGYLSLFTVQARLGLAPFALGLAITVGIACASVGVQVTKAARLNPATVLRHE